MTKKPPDEKLSILGWRQFLAIACWWACNLSALSGALIPLAGCTKRPSQIVIGRLFLDLPAEFDHQISIKDQIRTQVLNRLKEDPSVSFKPQSPSVTHNLRLISAPDGKTVRLHLRPIGDEPEYHAVGHSGGVSDNISEFLNAFEDAWQIVEQTRNFEVSSDNRLLVALGNPDPRIRAVVLELIAKRKIAGAVAALSQKLSTETEPELVLKTIGTLVSLGDPQAVPALIELTRQREPQFVVQVIFAIAAIGGLEAQAYLLTLATGHPDELVRQNAQDALKELEAKKQIGAKPQSHSR